MEEQHYQLLDGKAVSAQMKKEMAEEVAQIKAAGGKIPHLAAILVERSMVQRILKKLERR